MGVGVPLLPFSGSQAQQYGKYRVGRIIYGENGFPIRLSTGQFITTEDQLFVDRSNITGIRLESTVLVAQALNNVAAHQIVKFTGDGRVTSASYNDISTSTIAITTEDLIWEEVGNVCIQGVITDPSWAWSAPGISLWVDDAGMLTPINPHITDPVAHKINKPPVAKTISSTQIFFDQSMGGEVADGGGGGGSLDTLPYDISFFVATIPTDPTAIAGGSLVPRYVEFRSTSPHTARLMFPSPTETIFGVYVDTTQVGTVTFGPNSTIGIIDISPTNIAAGSTISIRSQTPSSLVENIYVTLVAFASIV